MPQGFPSSIGGFSRGFRESFFPTFQIATQLLREKGLEAERKEKAELARQDNLLKLSIQVLDMKNPRTRKLGLELLAKQNFGGDKNKTADVLKTIGTFSDQERAEMTNDLREWRQSILGGKKPSPELASRMSIYEKLFMRGETTVKDLVELSDKLGKRVNEEEALRMMGGGQEPEPGPSAPAPAAGAPAVIPAGLPAPGGVAQRGLPAAPGGIQRPAEAIPPAGAPTLSVPPVAPPGAAATAPVSGTVSPFDRPIEFNRRLAARLRSDGRPAFIKAAENMEAVVKSQVEVREKSEEHIRKIEKIKAEARHKTLERLEKEAKAKAKGAGTGRFAPQRPVALSPGSELVDPTTGALIASVPPKAERPVPGRDVPFRTDVAEQKAKIAAAGRRQAELEIIRLQKAADDLPAGSKRRTELENRINMLSKAEKTPERETRIADMMRTFDIDREQAIKLDKNLLEVTTDSAGNTWLVDKTKSPPTRRRVEIGAGQQAQTPLPGQGGTAAPAGAAAPDPRGTLSDALNKVGQGALGVPGGLAVFSGKTGGQLFSEGVFPNVEVVRQRITELRNDIRLLKRTGGRVSNQEQEKMEELVPSLGLAESYGRAMIKLAELKASLSRKVASEERFIANPNSPPRGVAEAKTDIPRLKLILEGIGEPIVPVSGPGEAKNLPPGTVFVTPDGVTRKVKAR